MEKLLLTAKETAEFVGVSFLFAFVVTALGAVKAVRVAWDEIDDALSNLVGLS